MWTLFLDEFGHEGPFLGKENPKYNQSPIFGFGGLAFESNQVIKFADDFAQMKSKLLSPKYRHKEIKAKIFSSLGDWTRKRLNLGIVRIQQTKHLVF
jgi:hypothetical protein